MDSEYFIKIPTWKDGEWVDNTTFDTREAFHEFIISIFKEPGQYEFDETSFNFNEQARLFNRREYYCNAPFRSKDYVKYWDAQKDRCRNGAIFKKGDKVWYLTREYYMWLNFLPIYDKEKKDHDFPDIYDTQYHLALYELKAELNWKHAAILKKRQIASSYFHAAKLLNQYWFEKGAKLKMGASLKKYINEKGTWQFLEEYRDFLNEHTAWYRNNQPNKVMGWEQKIQVTVNGRDFYRGNRSILEGISFEKDATSGVGGPCTYFFHEEAGIAPKMDTTYGYIQPAMQKGFITTGMFIASGSVGDLDQCEPLKKMILKPVENGIEYVESNLLDDKGTFGKHGLFIPEEWSMPPYMDQYGNSLVEEAKKALEEAKLQWKEDLPPEEYQLKISQRPSNIAEAFAYRKASVFPLHLLTAQQRRIEDKEYAEEYLKIFRDATGNIEVKKTKKLPILEFPVNKKLEDKTGCLVVYERPDKNAPWLTYMASIDPVSEGKTTTSESLCSIHVYKNPVEVTKIRHTGDVKSYIERDKIVATWCGRYDDINKTHGMLEMIIIWYNAWTLVENNISLFIQHMIARRLQKYLVPKDQVLFLKELQSNANVYQEYGWKNTGTLFKSHLISYLIEFLKEELDVETEPDGEIISITYGVERVPDIMSVIEMQQYHEGLNVDRLVSLAALVAFAKVQQANRGYAKRVDQDKAVHLEKSKEMFKLKSSPFRHIGKGRGANSGMKMPRSPFKNIK